MKRSHVVGLIVAAVLTAGAYYALNRTIAVTAMDISGFEPIRDDALARRHAPRLMAGNRYGDPEALLYRASRDDQGAVHITYHFVWPREINEGPGWKPFLNRWLYTGGLGIQRIMFGKKDIEQVSLAIRPDGVISRLVYETADDYRDSDFGVHHKTVTVDVTIEPNPLFEVMSWNHLFRRVPADAKTEGNTVSLAPAYFTEALWEDYTMVKREETPLRRNRAHLPYEREFVR